MNTVAAHISGSIQITSKLPLSPQTREKLNEEATSILSGRGPKYSFLCVNIFSVNGNVGCETAVISEGEMCQSYAEADDVDTCIVAALQELNNRLNEMADFAAAAA